MIEIKSLTKNFGEKAALNSVSFSIYDKSIFGLVGSNGAGKSTLLRVLAGVYSADGGEALIDGENPYENNALKEKIAFVSDFPYFISGYSLNQSASYYKSIYKSWDDVQFNRLKSIFPINANQKISTMSKGMQRQCAIILAMSYRPHYIMFDEIFDGLDPVIRELLKKVLIEYVDENGATVVIASHNLRELEGFCDHIGLLHLGGILLEKDIDGSSINLYRVQFIPKNDECVDIIKSKLNVLKEARQGKMVQLTVKGELEHIEGVINREEPIFFEYLPLTLEELFVCEMEVAGYDINNFFK